MKSSVDPSFYDRYVAIGNYIALVRRDKHMNQDEFAEFCGVSRSTISSLEAPKKDKTCTLDILFRISRAIGIDITELLSYTLPKGLINS